MRTVPNSHENVADARTSLTEYFLFYNDERPHQSLASRPRGAVQKTKHGA